MFYLTKIVGENSNIPVEYDFEAGNNNLDKHPGVIGLEDAPGKSVEAMQEAFEDTVRNICIPIINKLITDLQSNNGADAIGKTGGGTVQSHINTKADASNDPHGIKAYVNSYIGGGDMLKSVYDPTNKATDIYAYIDTVFGLAMNTGV